MLVNILLTERQKFVSIYDVISEICRNEGISNSDGAAVLKEVLKDELFDYVQRNYSSLVDYEELYDINCDPVDLCFMDIDRVIAENSFKKENRFFSIDNTYLHRGWYKNDLSRIFNSMSIDDLNCFGEDHISQGNQAMHPIEANGQNNTPHASDTSPIVDPIILDQSHPCYSPKLAAAISAWKYAASKYGQTQRTPKQLIMKWLDDNANDLGFNLNQTSKEMVAQVTNFRDASSTITKEKRKQHANEIKKYNESIKQTNKRTSNKNDFPDFDPEIPF